MIGDIIFLHIAVFGASLELSVCNLIVTLTAVCSRSKHVHKDHREKTLSSPSAHVFSPSVLLSLNLCGSARRADGCSHSKKLKGGKLFFHPAPFQSCDPTTFFFFSPGLFSGSGTEYLDSPQVPGLLGSSAFLA